MTQEEAIRQLKNQIVPNGQPASIKAIAMAVSALEKEKEPAPSANGTSSNEKIHYIFIIPSKTDFVKYK